MPKPIDISGQKYGRLTVRQKNGFRNNKTYWDCDCDCGNKVTIQYYAIVSGRSQSCGCLRKENPNHKTHGKSSTRIYYIWNGMIGRCTRSSQKCYEDYGGRGITVCEEWKKFEPFYDWAMANGYSDSMSIDRIDNDKGYFPENCRWVEGLTQANNKRNNRPVIQRTLSNEFVAIFESIAIAARETNSNGGNIQRVCSGKGASAGGYRWEYAN